jgi:PAS domain S-box-containing protein
VLATATGEQPKAAAMDRNAVVGANQAAQMPWVQQVSDSDALRRCIRDLVSLSTLPSIWRTCAPEQIAESLAATLAPMLNADFVHVALPRAGDGANIHVTHTGHGVAEQVTAALRAAVLSWLPNRTAADAVIRDPRDGTPIHVVSAPIESVPEALLIAGSAKAGFPTELQRLLIGIAANDATLGLARCYADIEQRRFVQLVDSSSDFIGVATLDGVPQYVNPAGLQMVGLGGLEQARRLNVLDFLAPPARERAQRELWPLVMQDGRWVGELSLQHFETGVPISCLIEWFRIDDPYTGRPINIATVSRNLTDQKAAQAELLQLTQTLERQVAARTAELAATNAKLMDEISKRERANARLHELQLQLLHAARLSAAGQMAAALAHDLNQPLAAATNSVRAAQRLLAKNDTAAAATARDVLDEAAAQVLRGGEIIRRLRGFVRRGESDMQTENLGTIVTEAIAFAGADSAGGGNGVQVELDLDPLAVDTFGDRLQIQQVLVNLMRNALEATAGGEQRHIKITTRQLDDATIEVGVADNGPGLTFDLDDHPFEPFVSSKRNGMGLGLSICRFIVEAHGGKLRSGANPGGGAVFRFTLPAGAGGPTDG